MIRDIAEFRRTGVASRRVAELDIPVAVRVNSLRGLAVQRHRLLRWWGGAELSMPFDRWCAALYQLARRAQVRIHTCRVRPAVASRHDDPIQLVYAFSVDPAAPRQPPAPPPRPRPVRLPVTSLADYRAGHPRRTASIARNTSLNKDHEDDEVGVDR